MTVQDGESGRARSGQDGFTMVEMLAVVAVMALLLAVVAPAAQGALRRAEVERSRARIGEIAQAIVSYRMSYGRYPSWMLAESGAIDMNEHLDVVLASFCGRSAVWVQGELAGLSRELNPLGVAFLRLERGDFTEAGGQRLLADGFGRTRIQVRIDRDEDGQLAGSELAGVEWACGEGPINASVLICAGDERDSAGGRLVVVWL